MQVRGFQYPLEPVRQRREWELEKTLVRLAALRRELADCEAKQFAMQQECAVQALQAGKVWERRADPVHQSRVLAYLAQLHGREHELEHRRCELEIQVKACRDESLLCNQALESIQRHRSDALAEFQLDQNRGASKQADEDWIVRMLVEVGT